MYLAWLPTVQKMGFGAVLSITPPMKHDRAFIQRVSKSELIQRDGASHTTAYIALTLALRGFIDLLTSGLDLFLVSARADLAQRKFLIY